MRTDMFVRCFHPAVEDHDEANPFERYPEAPAIILTTTWTILKRYSSAGETAVQ